MAIQLQSGAIFLHIPKTGGSWVEKTLTQLGLSKRTLGHKHADFERVIYPHDLREALRWTGAASLRKLAGKSTFPERPPMFCFVRNPLTWYESWWKFNQRLGWPTWGELHDTNHWHPCAALNDLGSPDFNRFIENVISQAPGFVAGLYLRYLGEGSPLVGHQESLQQDLHAILESLGYSIERSMLALDRVNESRIQEASPISWDETLRAEVLRLEYPVMKRCGYLDTSPGVKPTVQIRSRQGLEPTR